MKNKTNLNNKGFVLAETLVVSISVATIFVMFFSYFYPLMSEYNRRENYDDIDSKYGTYWVKRLIQSSDYNLSNDDKENIMSKGYVQFDCGKISDSVKKNMCKQMLIELEVSCDDINTKDKIESCASDKKPHIYITRYALVKRDKETSNETYNLKKKFQNDNTLTETLKEYIEYIPEYSKVDSLNNAEYRIIIEYYRHRFDTPTLESDKTSYEVDNQNDFLTYSTIEVRK